MILATAVLGTCALTGLCLLAVTGMVLEARCGDGVDRGLRADRGGFGLG
jgi:hypothetical protein